MMQKRADAKRPAHHTGRRGRSLPAALCGMLGRIMLLLVILACLPVPVARLCGYKVYNVVSGSMEPAVPVGSAVFVRSAPPAQLNAQDIIAFQSHGTVITHRVVENNTLESSLVTQGDANLQPDPEPVPYADVIGRVERHVPGLGWLLGSYTSGSGRLYLICFAAAGALFSLLPALLQKGQKHRKAGGDGQTEYGGTGAAKPDSGARQTAGDAAGAETGRRQRPRHAGAAAAKPGTGERVRRMLMVLLALVLLGSLGGYALVQLRAGRQRQAYIDLAQQYAAAPEAPQSAGAPGPAHDAPPITVDLSALQAVNSDIVGWIYCEGTPINYPILYVETNDTYLRRDFEKN